MPISWRSLPPPMQQGIELGLSSTPGALPVAYIAIGSPPPRRGPARTRSAGRACRHSRIVALFSVTGGHPRRRGLAMLVLVHERAFGDGDPDETHRNAQRCAASLQLTKEGTERVSAAIPPPVAQSSPRIAPRNAGCVRTDPARCGRVTHQNPVDCRACFLIDRTRTPQSKPYGCIRMVAEEGLEPPTRGL